MTYQAVFERGPRDGGTVNLPDLPMLYRFPVESPVVCVFMTEADAAATTEPMRTDVYELAFVLGRPSRDDAGRYRYEYRGTR